MKRAYYDHEPAYQRIQAAGGSGWDDLYAEPVEGSYRALEAFLASPLAPASGRALDLGCGGGQASRKLAARGYVVTGIDFSPTAIALARANDPAIEFLVGDCLALPFEAATFDLVVDNHVLHCLIGDDRACMLREAARVLRRGGLLFSETMSREGDLDLDKLGVDPTTFESKNGNRYWTTRVALDDELARAGFEIVARDEQVAGPGEGTNLMRVARR